MRVVLFYFNEMLFGLICAPYVRRIIILMTILTRHVCLGVQDITIYVCNKHLTNPSKGNIMSINTRTKEVQAVPFTDRGENPFGVAYDKLNNKLYWTSETSDIKTVSVKGATYNNVLVHQGSKSKFKFQFIAVDSYVHYLLFSSNGSDSRKMFRYNLRGVGLTATPVCTIPETITGFSLFQGTQSLFYGHPDFLGVTRCYYGTKTGDITTKYSFAGPINFDDSFGVGPDLFEAVYSVYYTDKSKKKLYKGTLEFLHHTSSTQLLHTESKDGAHFRGVKLFFEKMYVTTGNPQSIRVFSKEGANNGSFENSAFIYLRGIDVAYIGDMPTTTTDAYDQALAETDPSTMDPSTANRDPTTGNGAPATGERDPSTGNGAPATGERDPSTGNGGPATGVRDPSTRNGGPATGVREPSTGNVGPATGEKDPSTGAKDPSRGLKYPSRDAHIPPTDARGAATGDRATDTKTSAPKWNPIGAIISICFIIILLVLVGLFGKPFIRKKCKKRLYREEDDDIY